MPVSTTGRPAAVLSILVTANTRPARGSLAAMDRQMAYSATGAKNTAASWERSFARIGAAAKLGAVGVAAGVAGAVVAATNFESAFASVRKTVRATEPQFKALRTGILDMSEQIPESANSLAELAGEAGALGVKQKDLLSFTRTASKLGTTTNLSSNAAADALARLSNVMSPNGDLARNTRKMGSVLVDLGNKGASTEDEIAAMALRISGAGAQLGLGSQQVLGLAAALSNLGIRAEMGGSAVSRIMLAMDAAVTDNGKELTAWAKVAGTSTEEFTRIFEKDPTTAIQTFATGLGKVKDEGGSTSAALEDLGKAAHTSMNEIRVRDVLLRLANSMGEVADTQHIANKEWENTNALNIEARKRYQTLASQVDLLKNNIVRLGIDMGSKLLPTIKETVKLLQDPKLTLDEKIQVLMQQVGKLFEKAAPMMAEVGAMLGAGLAKGLASGFIHADIWGKLFIATAFVRLVGGPGALAAVGSALGAPIAKALGSAIMGTAMVTSAKAAMAGTASAGIAEAIGGGMVTSKAPMIASIVGRLAPILSFAFAAAIPLAIGGIGVVNLLTSAFAGDFKTAGFELGGALVGGIAGFFVGGPLGAVVGAGLGTFLGDALEGPLTSAFEGIFGGGSKLTKFQQQLKDSAENMADAMGRQKRAGDRLRDASHTWDRAKQREKRTSQAVKKAEDNLAEARRKYPAKAHPVLEAEVQLARAKNRDRRATVRLKNAEKLHGVELDAYKVSTRLAVIADKDRIQVLQRQRRHIDQDIKQAKRDGTLRERASEFTRRLTNNEKKLNEAHKNLNDTVGEAARVVNPKYAKQLEHLNATQVHVRQNYKRSQRAEEDLGIETQGLTDLTKAYRAQSDKTTEWDVRNFRKRADAHHGLSQTIYQGEKASEKNFDSSTDALGLDMPGWGLVAPPPAQRKQRGGIIRGAGPGDKIHVLAEPGEGFINKVATRRMGGKAAIDAINSAMPRFQGGGIVGLGHQLQAQGYEVSENPAFGGVTPGAHVAGSFHYSGQALDVSDDVPPFASGSGEPGSLDQLYARLKGMPGVIELLWRVADHFDHLHVAMAKGASGLSLGPAVEKIARQIIKGPDGPYKRRGQGQLDKITKAANKKLMRSSDRLTGFTGGTNLAYLERLWVQAGGPPGIAHLMAAIAMAESGGNPQAHNPSGATGLWQILGAIVPGNLFDPMVNAKNAVAKYRSQGLGAWVAYTNGNYRQYMQQGGVAMPFVGSYERGGIAPREGFAHVHRGEPIGINQIRVKIEPEWLREFIQVEIESNGDSSRRMARARR